MSKREVREVTSSEAKNSWHEILDQVSREHRSIVVTRYGKPIARLEAFHEEDDEPAVFGALAGTVRVHGDLTAPLDESWDADG